MIRAGKTIRASFGAAVIAVGLLGCTTTPMWDPGAPDALTKEHYDLVRAAIEAKSQIDAEAAFYLLRSDALRLRTNTLAVQAALVSLYRASGQVERGDWDAALNNVLALKATYGRP